MATSKIHKIPGMQECIEACQRCHRICLHTAMTQCLEMGGKHTEAEHLRLVLNCAELCQTTANFMLCESSHHAAVCALCAEICTACADDCDRIGDMRDCVAACRNCAKLCEGLSMPSHGRQQRTDAHSTQHM